LSDNHLIEEQARRPIRRSLWRGLLKRCPNCGAQLELAGKGLIVCPYCGTEVFLHKD
jgi:uncharacterized protein (DUF983 family)